MITQKYLKECVTYNPESGLFFWKRRPVHHFKDKSYQTRWNNRYSLTECASVLVSNGKVNSYRRLAINNRKYFAHRLAWLYCYGHFPDDQIDHINGDTSDNRICNLRNVSACANRRNMKLNRLNKTGISGVSKASSNVWRVTIGASENHDLFYCYDFFEACCIRKSLEIKHGFHENHGRTS